MITRARCRTGLVGTVLAEPRPGALAACCACLPLLQNHEVGKETTMPVSYHVVSCQNVPDFTTERGLRLRFKDIRLQFEAGPRALIKGEARRAHYRDGERASCKSS